MEYRGGSSGSMAGGFGSPNPSTPGSEGAKKRKGYDEQNILPVTIKMIQDTQMPSGILRDGREPHQVKIVGAIREQNNGSTNITYSIEDGTGLMDMKEWVDAENDNSAILEFRDRVAKEGRYVRIIGKITDYEGKKEVVAHSVRPLSSANELTHHMLEVVYSAEKYKKGQQIVGAPNPYESSYVNTSTGFSVDSGVNMQNRTPVKQIGSMGIMNGSSRKGAGENLQDLVLQYIRSDASMDGAGTNILPFIAQHSAKYSESQIRNAVSEISSEGLIYSTIDDNHYTGV